MKWRVGGAVERLTVGWWGIRMQIGSVSSESRGNDTLSTTLKKHDFYCHKPITASELPKKCMLFLN